MRKLCIHISNHFLFKHEALECVFLPASFIWQEKLKLSLEQVDMDVLRRTVIWEATQRLHTARTRLKNGQIYKDKKEVVHYLLFVQQLAREGRIHNYGAANGYLEEVLANKSINWEEYIAESSVKIVALKEELKKEVPIHKFYGRAETKRYSIDYLKRETMKKKKLEFTKHRTNKSEINAATFTEEGIPNDFELKLVSFLKREGLNALVSLCCVMVSRHPQHSNLVHFVSLVCFYVVEFISQSPSSSSRGVSCCCMIKWLLILIENAKE